MIQKKRDPLLYWLGDLDLPLDSSLFDRCGIDYKDYRFDPFIGLKGKSMSGGPIDRLKTI